MKNKIERITLLILAIGYALSGAYAAEVTLNFQDNSDNERGFIIERAEAPDGPFVEIVELSENETTYLDTTISHDKRYWWRVFAYNNVGETGYSNTVTHIALDPKYSQPFEENEAPSNLNIKPPE